MIIITIISVGSAKDIGMHVACLAVLAATVVGPSVSAQTYIVHRVASSNEKGFGEVHIAKAAIAGQEVRIWWAIALNPDCTTGAKMQSEILQFPRHGSVRLSDDSFYPNFTLPNPRAACDVKPEPGKQAFYTSRADFHGHDKLVLQNATSEGRIRKITVDIDVR